jgi:hypothetical protein
VSAFSGNNNQGINAINAIPGKTAYDIASDENLESYQRLSPEIIDQLVPSPPQNNNANIEILQGNTTLKNSINTFQTGVLSAPNTLTTPDPLKVYDVFEFAEVTLTLEEIKNDTENIYFSIGLNFFRLPRDSLKDGMLDTYSNIIFSCDAKQDGALFVEDINSQEPYYMVRSAGNYLVRLSQMIAILNQQTYNVFKLVSDIELNYTVSFNSIMRKPDYRNYSGRKVNIVNADHCQDGSNRILFNIIPITIVAATSGGRKTKKTKKKKANKTKRKTNKTNKKTRRLNLSR